MGTNAPSGWLMCDGTAYPTNQYPASFAAIGSSCGASGNTFNVPDCMGVFLRRVNGRRSDSFADPDDNTNFRTNIFAGGNEGGAVGSYQEDMFAAHKHDNGSLTCGENVALGACEPYGVATAGALLLPFPSGRNLGEHSLVYRFYGRVGRR